MAFQFTENFKSEVEDLLKGKNLTINQIEQGLNALEKFISIDAKYGFDTEYGNTLNDLVNDNILSSGKWHKGKDDIRIEEFLKKMIYVKEGYVYERLQLMGCYRSCGFVAESERDEIKPIWIDKPEAKFQDRLNFDTAKPDMFNECPGHVGDYVRIYICRNDYKHDGVLTREPDALELRKSLLAVFVDQCYKNMKFIKKCYEIQLINKINFEKFAYDRLEELSDEIDEFKKTYKKLEWNEEGQNAIQEEQRTVNSIKFIGEAGSGKTTEMKNRYFLELNDVNHGGKYFPVWINLYELQEESASIKEKLTETLASYIIPKNIEETAENMLDVTMNHEGVHLFLDGYNEILDQNIRMNIARELDNVILKKYKNLPIMITDRTKRSNPPYMMTNVKIEKLTKMSKEDWKKYVKKKYKERYDDFCEYVESEQSSWMEADYMIPFKLDVLSDYIYKKKTCESDDFYNAYLDKLLDREEVEKKETNIQVLQSCLKLLAQKMHAPQELWTSEDIAELWKVNVKHDIKAAYNLVNLALELSILETDPEAKVQKCRFKRVQYYERYLYRNI